MIIVLDTNVLTSAMLQPRGKPARVLDLILSRKVLIAYDRRIMMEYREVLHRPKFKFDKTHVETVFGFLEREGMSAIGSIFANSLPEPDDNPFLEVAIGADVDALVTGNKRHYPSSVAGKVKILSPVEFLRYFQDALK